MSSYTTIENQDGPVLVVLDDSKEVVVVSGSIGPKGDPGNLTVAGTPVVISNLQSGDVLQYNSILNYWTNIPQSSITDGGTF